ncbi:hypothetical protein SDC9_169734 [bioreactor metagenome]|uniref:Methyl-accepting chemotaxis protein IV n=1 Tax=bioreactor metagenome TaxID=1076179 RepID=A0A645G647_9ZZZZ
MLVKTNIEEIDRSSAEQAVAISQITLGVDQVSVVVQTNSATAEQSAAASQELFDQSEKLHKEIIKFKLRVDSCEDAMSPEQNPVIEITDDSSKY